MPRSCLAIILAAGDGTRMRSSRSKVLHEVAGLAMVRHVVRTAMTLRSVKVALVVGRDGGAVEEAARMEDPAVQAFAQTERRGTAHAVLTARSAIAEADPETDILVLFGDTPLIREETLQRARHELAEGAHICVIGFRPPDPFGYGRLILEGENLIAIREEKDASADQRSINFCNGGVMALRAEHALAMLDQVGNANAKGEFYLTDLVEIATSAGRKVKAIEAETEEVLGVNTRIELAAVEDLWQARRRRDAMLNGVTLVAPTTVFFSHDTKLAADVVVEPNVVFGPGVAVAGGARIHAFCHLEGAQVGEDVSVGPFARLRSGTVMEKNSKVGNFCETKNARVSAGAKINHLSYIGDADIGAGSNIGAGTITCNYDGASKHRTVIGASAFIGSNSALVAPVTIGDSAYVGSGSVITDDVPEGGLAIARSRQVTKANRGREIMQRNAELKRSQTSEKPEA